MALLAARTAASEANSLALEAAVRERLAAVDQVGAAPDQEPRGVGVERDVGDHVLHQLEARRSAGRTGCG